MARSRLINQLFHVDAYASDSCAGIWVYRRIVEMRREQQIRIKLRKLANNCEKRVVLSIIQCDIWIWVEKTNKIGIEIVFVSSANSNGIIFRYLPVYSLSLYMFHVHYFCTDLELLLDVHGSMVKFRCNWRVHSPLNFITIPISMHTWPKRDSMRKIQVHHIYHCSILATISIRSITISLDWHFYSLCEFSIFKYVENFK